MGSLPEPVADLSAFTSWGPRASDRRDRGTCDKFQELFNLLAGLPRSTVDVIVAGHTHAAIAGQYAKPRSADVEIRGDVTLPA